MRWMERLGRFVHCFFCGERRGRGDFSPFEFKTIPVAAPYA